MTVDHEGRPLTKVRKTFHFLTEGVMRRVGTCTGLIGAAALSLVVLGACSSANDGADSSTESTPVVESSAPGSTPSSVASADPTSLYKLAITEDGSSTRFDSCAGPIKILLNPGDLQAESAQFTDVDVADQLGDLFTTYAQELSELTGLEIVYGGLTDKGLDPALADAQVIVITFGPTGFPGREDSYEDQVSTYGKTKDGWVQIVNFQHFENSNGFAIHFEEGAKVAGGDRTVGIDEAGKRWLKTILGKALGLEQLTEDDMMTAGIPTEEHGAQIMYTDSHQEQDGSYNLTWGEGDKAGLAAVGANAGCF